MQHFLIMHMEVLHLIGQRCSCSYIRLLWVSGIRSQLLKLAEPFPPQPTGFSFLLLESEYRCSGAGWSQPLHVRIGLKWKGFDSRGSHLGSVGEGQHPLGGTPCAAGVEQQRQSITEWAQPPLHCLGEGGDLGEIVCGLLLVLLSPARNNIRNYIYLPVLSLFCPWQ